MLSMRAPDFVSKHRTMCALLHCALGVMHAPLSSLILPGLRLTVRALDRACA